MTPAGSEERVVGIDELSETLAPLRVLDDESLRRMRESLAHHGQLMALAVYRPSSEGAFEIVDGFKRLRAARALGWVMLRVRVLAVEAAQAKAAIGILNHGRGLTELEEAWLVRSLYRDDRLSQPEIGRLLERHKSWVSRRLLLAEGLDELVQTDVRLGLIAAKSAIAVARLPRGNQRELAQAVMQRGLTQVQTERVVADVLSSPDRAGALAQALERVALAASAAARGRDRPAERTPAQQLVADVVTITRSSARLQARLWERPLSALGETVSQLVAGELRGFLPVLSSLRRAVERAVQEVNHGSVQDASGVGAQGDHARAPGAGTPGCSAGHRSQP